MMSDSPGISRAGDIGPAPKAAPGAEGVAGPLEELRAGPTPTKEPITVTTDMPSPTMAATPRHTDYHLLLEARRTGDYSRHSGAIARTAMFSLSNLAAELPSTAEVREFTEALQKYRRDPAFLSWAEDLAMSQRLPIAQLRDLLVALPGNPQATLSLPEQNRIVGIWERTGEAPLRQWLATMPRSPHSDVVRGSIESALLVKEADATLARLGPAFLGAAQRIPGSTRISLASIMRGIEPKLPPPATARIMNALVQCLADNNWANCLREIKDALNLPPREMIGDPLAYKAQSQLLEYLLNVGRTNYDIPIFHTAICGLNYLHAHRDEVKKYEYIQEFQQSVHEGILEPHPELKFGTPAWEQMKRSSRNGQLMAWLSAAEQEQAGITPDQRAITYDGPEGQDWAAHRDAEPVIHGLLGEMADLHSPGQMFDMQLEFLSYLFTNPSKVAAYDRHPFKAIDNIVGQFIVRLLEDAPDLIPLLHRAVTGGYITREEALTLLYVPTDNPDWKTIVAVRKMFANALPSFPPDEQAKIVTHLRRAQGGGGLTKGLLQLVATEARHVTSVPLPEREAPYDTGIDVLFTQYVAPPDRMPPPARQTGLDH